MKFYQCLYIYTMTTQIYANFMCSISIFFKCRNTSGVPLPQECRGGGGYYQLNRYIYIYVYIIIYVVINSLGNFLFIHHFLLPNLIHLTSPNFFCVPSFFPFQHRKYLINFLVEFQVYLLTWLSLVVQPLKVSC